MKRIIAGGAVGFGLGSIGATRSSDDVESDTVGKDRDDGFTRHPELVLVFADDYYSEVPFQPIDRIPQEAVNLILGHRADESDSVVAHPTDYNGYVINYRPDLPGKYTFAFVNRRTLRQDQRYRFTDDVVFFNDRLNLVSAAVTTADDADESPAETTTVTNETTATENETTTQEVLVETTERDDG